MHQELRQIYGDKVLRSPSHEIFGDSFDNDLPTSCWVPIIRRWEILPSSPTKAIEYIIQDDPSNPGQCNGGLYKCGPLKTAGCIELFGGDGRL
eukprot:Pgem_evm1s5419